LYNDKQKIELGKKNPTSGFNWSRRYGK